MFEDYWVVNPNLFDFVQVNNAGISGVCVEGDVSLLREYIVAATTSLVDGGQEGLFST